MLKNSPGSDEAKDAIIGELLKELPTDAAVEVNLPSENKLYTLEDPNLPITIRPMTFEDEKAIVNANKDQDPLLLVLQKCVSNINIQELLPMDKFCLILKLREISYGDDYKTLLICPECKAENPVTIKLSELPINPVPDDFSDPIEVELPILKTKMNIRLPRVRDEKYFTEQNSEIDQLWRFVVDVSGYTDKSIISAVVDKLPLKDGRTILNALKTDYGVEERTKLLCKDCGGVSVVGLPIDANFFDVN